MKNNIEKIIKMRRKILLVTLIFIIARDFTYANINVCSNEIDENCDYTLYSASQKKISPELAKIESSTESLKSKETIDDVSESININFSNEVSGPSLSVYESENHSNTISSSIFSSTDVLTTINNKQKDALETSTDDVTETSSQGTETTLIEDTTTPLTISSTIQETTTDEPPNLGTYIDL